MKKMYAVFVCGRDRRRGRRGGGEGLGRDNDKVSVN